jgi:hypothetical protein
MWRRLAVGLLLAGGPGAALSDESAPFASILPGTVGDVSGWAIEAGQFQTGAARGSYRLYVNPQRAALYQLMRYRVELLAATSTQEQQRGTAERVAFIRRPGVREPMESWRRLPGDVTEWREVAAGTDEYLVEMGVVMHVLAAHRAATAAATPAP